MDYDRLRNPQVRLIRYMYMHTLTCSAGETCSARDELASVRGRACV